MAPSVKYPLSSDNLLQGLSVLREEKSLCDVELVAENETFPVHRVVLAAASPYFKAMFTGGFKENEQNKIELKEVPHAGVSAVLDAIYTSEVEITEDNVESLLSAASLFQMDEIVKYCETFLCENVSEDNFFAFLAISERYNLKEGVHSCDEFMVDNFESLTKFSDFCKLSKEKLCEFISDDRLKLPNGEIEVFRAATRWLENNLNKDGASTEKDLPESAKEMEDTVEVLKLVRFPHISSDLLLDEVLQHSLIDKSDNRVLEAIRFHTSDFQLKQPLCEGLQYRSRGEPKIVITKKGKRDKDRGYAVTERETKLHWFTLSDNTLHEHDETVYPHSFVRYSVSLLAKDIYLFVFAVENESFKPVALLFNSILKRWTELKAPPGPGSIGARAVRVKDKIYLTGGMRVTKETPFQLISIFVNSTVLQYTIGSDTWKELYDMPQALMYHAAVSHEGLVYVAGGYSSSNTTSRKTYAYDTSGDVWLTKADMNHARCNFCLECVDENLYACGGRVVDGDKLEQSIEMYSMFDDQWTVLENATVDHGKGSTSFVLNNQLYIVGGQCLDSSYSNCITFVDMVSKTVAGVSTIPLKCSYHTCAVLTTPRT